MTNYERIVSMGTKDLASLIHKSVKWVCDYCIHYYLSDDCEGCDCEAGVIAWLEEETE